MTHLDLRIKLRYLLTYSIRIILNEIFPNVQITTSKSIELTTISPFSIKDVVFSQVTMYLIYFHHG